MKIPDQWTFKSTDIAQGFDHHVREQLPWYSLATGIVAHTARHYIPHDGLVYDIGASTGNIGIAIAQCLASRKATFYPIDNAPQMAQEYKGPGTLTVEDALHYQYQPFDFAVCFLVLMFLPVSERTEFIGKLRGLIKPGGAMIIFDKCEPVKGYVSVVMSRLALAEKLVAGVEPSEIISKELSLAGIQRPLSIGELGEGAQEIFRFGDFAGWIIEGSLP